MTKMKVVPSTELTKLLQHPDALTQRHIPMLKDVIAAFPYFQSARCLYLKGLKDQGSFLYNQELKKTAAYTTDRSVLFEVITTFPSVRKHLESTSTSPALMNATAQDDQNDIEVTAETIGSLAVSDGNISKPETTPEPADNPTVMKALGIHEPLHFDTNEMHSFSKWLQLTSLRPIQRNAMNTDEKNNLKEDKQKEQVQKTPQQQQQLQLIDNFIAKNPKISPVSKHSKPRNLAKEIPIATEELMTETLAKVYLAQKKYKKAIQAYNILILKNPEKSGFFADQIRFIQQLKDNT